MATFHLKKSVIAGGSLGTVKAMKKYWNQPVSDIDDSSTKAKYTILQMAIMLNKKKIVEYLVPQQDLDLNTKAADKTTALMTAVEKKVPNDWVQAMLERGAKQSINDEDEEGRTALDRCEKGSEVYELLIKYGAVPRPEKPPTPPPEPEPKPLPPPPQPKPAEKKAPPSLGQRPGLEDHPGFWSTMCGCGGRPFKGEGIEAIS